MNLVGLDTLLDLVVLAVYMEDEELKPVPTVDEVYDPAGEFEYGR